MKPLRWCLCWGRATLAHFRTHCMMIRVPLSKLFSKPKMEAQVVLASMTMSGQRFRCWLRKHILMEPFHTCGGAVPVQRVQVALEGRLHSRLRMIFLWMILPSSMVKTYSATMPIKGAITSCMWLSSPMVARTVPITL